VRLVEPPQLQSLDPPSGRVAGGYDVRIWGYDFFPNPEDGTHFSPSAATCVCLVCAVCVVCGGACAVVRVRACSH
jgi:hypothetical protein